MAEDVVTIHLRFGVDTALGLYQDTLVFTEAEWAKRDDKAIAIAKQDLADTWVTFRSAQIAEEEALRKEQGKQDRIAEIDGKIAELATTKEQIVAESAAVAVSVSDVGAKV